MVERNIRITVAQRRRVIRYLYLVKITCLAVEIFLNIRNERIPVTPHAPLVSVHAAVVASFDRKLQILHLGILQRRQEIITLRKTSI